MFISKIGILISICTAVATAIKIPDEQRHAAYMTNVIRTHYADNGRYNPPNTPWMVTLSRGYKAVDVINQILKDRRYVASLRKTLIQATGGKGDEKGNGMDAIKKFLKVSLEHRMPIHKGQNIWHIDVAKKDKATLAKETAVLLVKKSRLLFEIEQRQAALYQLAHQFNAQLRIKHGEYAKMPHWRFLLKELDPKSGEDSVNYDVQHSVVAFQVFALEDQLYVVNQRLKAREEGVSRETGFRTKENPVRLIADPEQEDS